MKGKNLIFPLLLKNTSFGRVAAFVISNFIGLAIIIGGIIFYRDAGSLWSSDDSFLSSDYLVINKKVQTSDFLGEASTAFNEEEIEELRKQAWVRDIGEFTSNKYKVWASIGGDTGRSLSTMLFFEAVPDKFVDGVAPGEWDYKEDDDVVPVIMSKDYLTLYNFGFAGSQGLPKLTEGIMGSIPMKFTLRSEDGTKIKELNGRIVGFSGRLNTILVPQSFMEWSNSELSNNQGANPPSRLIIDVSSPGDVAIKEYLDSHDMESAGDKSISSAAFLLKIVTGIVITVGALITLMSFMILLLSVSLLMEKNRQKLHSLLMLGYPLGKVAAPYIMIVTISSALAYGGAVLFGLLLRGSYIDALTGLGATPESPWVGLLVGALATVAIILLNILAVKRRVKSSWR